MPGKKRPSSVLEALAEAETAANNDPGVEPEPEEVAEPSTDSTVRHDDDKCQMAKKS